MKLKKALALILAFAMILALTACNGQQEPATDPTSSPATLPPIDPVVTPTTEPTTAPTTEPVTEPVSGDQLYNSAIAALEQSPAYILNIKTDRTVTVGNISYSESSEQMVLYSDYGTDTFAAYATDTVVNGDYITTYQEHFQDGTLYTVLDDDFYYKGALTAEEYISRFAPVIMLDAALYGQIDVNGSTLTFSAPTAGESWIVPEYAELVDAVGTARLDANNAITAYTYHVTYAIGGSQIHYVIEMEIDPEDSVNMKARNESTEYTELEFVDALRFIEQAAGYLWQYNTNHSISASLTESIITQAGGAVRNQSITVESWGSGDDYVGSVDLSIYLATATSSDSYEQEEVFQNNTYTISTDGGTPTKQAGVTAAKFRQYCVETIASAIPYAGYATECTATDLGSIYYLELTFTEELAEALKGSACATFWNDEAFLDDLCDDYYTQEITGYLSIDKNTGLPLAAGYYYEGYHTLEGYDYMLSLQQDQAFDLLSAYAYEEVTDEPPVPEEPEEKATPLFYHVTGADGQEMWLLGTIHIGDARTSYLPQEIYDAFDAADALAVEFNSEAFYEQLDNDEELSNQVSENYFYSDGSLTEDHVEDEELFMYAEMYMKATGNYHMNAPYLKVSAWSNAIDNFFTQQTYDLNSTQGVDNQLIWRAEAQNKEILDVESGLFQVQMLYSFSEELQEYLLYGSVYTDPYAYANDVRELFEMWCAGDEAELIAYLNEETDDSELTDEELALIEEYNNAMGTDRNDDMHDVAVDYLESGDVVFYAVGLAHLLAEDGLVNTLRAAGYTVELVSYE